MQEKQNPNQPVRLSFGQIQLSSGNGDTIDEHSQVEIGLGPAQEPYIVRPPTPPCDLCCGLCGSLRNSIKLWMGAYLCSMLGYGLIVILFSLQTSVIYLLYYFSVAFRTAKAKICAHAAFAMYILAVIVLSVAILSRGFLKPEMRINLTLIFQFALFPLFLLLTIINVIVASVDDSGDEISIFFQASYIFLGIFVVLISFLVGRANIYLIKYESHPPSKVIYTEDLPDENF